MSKFKVKKLPPIRLVDLLRKRKTNLKQFLSSSGIVAYVTLLQKCEKMGVSPPNEEEFKNASGPIVSSPQEGVVVLDPPTLLSDSGQKVEVDSFMEDTPQSPTAKTKTANSETKRSKKSNPSRAISIDESVFITSVSENSLEKSGPNLGDESSVDDDIDISVSKLNTLKKLNDSAI